MSRTIPISRAELVAALVKREAVSIAEGEAPTFTACLWCGKLVARSKNRPRTPRRFCRPVPPAKNSPCMWKWQHREDVRRARWAQREPYLVGPSSSFEDWLEWAHQILEEPPTRNVRGGARAILPRSPGSE